MADINETTIYPAAGVINNLPAATEFKYWIFIIIPKYTHCLHKIRH